MINTKLLLLEYANHDNNVQEKNRLAAIQSIRGIVSQVDFTAEIVPIDEPERLIKLLTSLKGERLTGQEINVLYDVANI